MIGIQAARFFNNDMSWDILTPLQPLPEIPVASLEQDVSGPRFLSRQEARKLKDLCYMDRLNEEWDPNTEIEQILRYRHRKYRRRTPGTGNYGPFAAYVTTRRIRSFVKFFNGVKQWIPMEAARNDNPIH
jgi:hypothetical protein